MHSKGHGQGTVEIRQLMADDVEAMRDLRLGGLESDPRAFGETAGEFRAVPVGLLVERLENGGGRERFVLGAFEGSHLVGMTGFYRELRAPRQHKAQIWGVYVRPSHRGRGVGRALLTAVVEKARTVAGLRLLQLSVSMTQQPARALYLSLGFRSWGMEPEALHAGGEYLDEDHLYLPL